VGLGEGGVGARKGPLAAGGARALPRVTRRAPTRNPTPHPPSTALSLFRIRFAGGKARYGGGIFVSKTT
jgi:hypothetical protein